MLKNISLIFVRKRQHEVHLIKNLQQGEQLVPIGIPTILSIQFRAKFYKYIVQASQIF